MAKLVIITCPLDEAEAIRKVIAGTGLNPTGPYHANEFYRRLVKAINQTKGAKHRVGS